MGLFFLARGPQRPNDCVASFVYLFILPEMIVLALLWVSPSFYHNQTVVLLVSKNRNYYNFVLCSIYLFHESQESRNDPPFPPQVSPVGEYTVMHSLEQ